MQKTLLSGCNLILYCRGNINESTLLLKGTNKIDKFTIKKTKQFYQFFEIISINGIKNNLDILVDIPNYSGPLQTLLDLAKNQKVDLTEISVTVLADHFLDFIKNSKNLDLAFEYLIMATWLAYLKSKLLLPEDEDDEFKASDIAEKLKLQLKKLELIRLLSDQLLKRDRIGKTIFYRGMKGGIRSINNTVYKVTLYELLKSYSGIKVQSLYQTINIPKLPVMTTQEGIKQIKNNMTKIDDWKKFRN